MSLPKASVLLVDDVEANLVALEGLLEDLPCDLVRARGGNEALRQLLKREFAVMLLDVQMPEMDGYEVARYARQNPVTRDVPIIFLTAMHDSEDSMLRGYGSGAVDFLFKPLNAHVLRAKVRVFIELYLIRQGLASEVAAHKATLKELELSNTALRHFTQAASHDLKAPLRAVRGFLDVLQAQAGPGLDAQSRDYLERSRKASQRMDSLLNALATYARLRRPTQEVEVDCGQVLEHVLSDLSERITATEASVVVGELPKLRGDADRIYQLFLNLVANALKFQPPGRKPRVEISASTRDREWVLCVADNGIGIDAAHREAVFDAFRRLHAESSYEGTGLGLAICQQIVLQHGGAIWIESEPNEGSRFYIRWPQSRAST